MRRIARRAVRTVQGVTSAIRRPTWVPPGHYYSPISSPADVERALSWPAEAPGVDLREAEQLELWEKLLPMLDLSRRRYDPGNGIYGRADAAVYQAMLRHLRPRRVIEVGSGYSTACLLDTAEEFALDIEITCIEPAPKRLMRLLGPGDDLKVRLLRQPVQEIPLAAYTALHDGDVLFIDSTHVVKAGSDVVWLLLRVLPTLNAGVTVHFHDIGWPFEYGEQWLRQGRDWTEAYALHAFLVANQQWQVSLFSNWLWRTHADVVPEWMARAGGVGGALWLRKTI
ncbi:class I SAM-dependent methyltransferase [Actinopolymorpha alba]|uniref:class I SAM-dependent methyltransferase n=1 Tax=Actinopolymorpha alba TaxID=533267 RepID=UPI00035F55E7|nr:class I SAM-dependent methyltransferase [Actinopolymorpha alba]